MASEYLASELLASVRLRGLFPDAATQPYAEADFYRILNEETRLYMLPLLREVNESLLVTRKTFPIVASTRRYRLPSRCSMEAVHRVFLHVTGVEPEEPLTLVSRELTGTQGYFLEDDVLVLTFTPPTGQSLTVAYFRRPSKLVGGTAACRVMGINGSILSLKLADESSVSAPSTFTTSERYDLIRGEPGFRTLGDDVQLSNVTSAPPTICNATLTASPPVELAVGDFLALAGQSPVPQLPYDALPLLSARVAYVLASGLSAARGLAMKPELERTEARVREALRSRVEAQSPVLVNPYAKGWRRSRIVKRFV